MRSSSILNPGIRHPPSTPPVINEQASSQVMSTSPPTINVALVDELASLNAIFGPGTLTLHPPISTTTSTSTSGSASASTLASISDITVILTLPSRSDISFTLSFPSTYPTRPPLITGTSTTGSLWRGKGEAACSILRTLLSSIYIPGEECLFDLISSSSSLLPPKEQDQHEDVPISLPVSVPPPELNPPPTWFTSEVLSVKKSTFQARAATVTSTQEARACIAHLISTDKKASAATHNISAYRISSATKTGPGNVEEDYDDDGESAAGARLLHMLQLMALDGVLVVVSRWFGGTKLGPDRFRYVNQVAKEAVLKAGFARKQHKSEK